MQSPVPPNEAGRLIALRDYDILDTLHEDEFDRITEIASIVCDVPISLVSLIDENRQWFKSNHGLKDVRETPREIAFCQHAIMHTSIFEIEDATRDKRFLNNVLVTESPSIRFYAGYPLIDDKGYALGTLCVIDQKPKVLKPGQKRALELLAQEVMTLITERLKRVELRNFEKLFEYSNDLMFVGSNGIFTKVNPSFSRLLGFTDSYFLSKPSVELVHPDDVGKMLDEFEKLKRGEPSVNFTVRFKAEDESYKTIQWTSSPELSSRKVFGIGRDVTEKVLVEADLKATQEMLEHSVETQEALNEVLLRQIQLIKEQDHTIEKIQEFQFLANSIPQIIWTALPNGRTDYYNQHWFDYTGLNVEQSTEAGWIPVLHPEDKQKTLKEWKKSIETGRPFEVECRFRRVSDGAYKWHLGTAKAMRGENNEIIKWFGFCTDIDEYKRALDLERKIGQYEDFNRIVAHNLRGPAGSIKMLLSIINHEKPAEKEKAEIMGMLEESSDTLLETLNELMKVLEVRNSRNLAFDICDLEGIVQNVERMLKGQILSKQAEIIREFDLATVKFPKIYLESIFYNMISNALKYSKPDEPPYIRISASLEVDKVILRFLDNGLGLDLDKYGDDMFKLNKVFHPGHDSKGIGLFMTKTQIETFGGSIRVESKPGQGSEFIIEL